MEEKKTALSMKLKFLNFLASPIGKAVIICMLYMIIIGILLNISSEKERKSAEVERAVDDLYKTKYMENFIGQEFDGVISGVTSFGIFTELENTVEGFTRIEDLPRGNYTFDAKSFTLSSPKHTYKLGDRVRIGVLGVDISARRTEFIILYKLT